jgi:predicted dehydrogenase
MEPVRLGIVGCGGISERHARAAARSEEVSFVACCDSRIDVAERWSAANGCERFYDDYRAMVGEHELDAVVIATWPTQHREHVLSCLESGLRFVLCEKALATNREDALEIFHAAQVADAVVVEALMYRHHPAIEKIEQLLASGELGAIDNIRACFSLRAPEDSAADDPLRDWRQRVECGGGVPYDLACYCVDACNHLAGSAPRRAVALGTHSDRYGTIDRLYGLIEYEAGPVGIVSSSSRSDFDHELRISGELGHVGLPVAWRIESATSVTVSRSVGWGAFRHEEFRVELADPYRLQLESFAAVVRGRSEPVPPLAESVVAMATLDALVRSAVEREPVEIELPEDVEAALASPG